MSMRNRSVAILCFIILLAGVSVAQTNSARQFDEFSGFNCEDLKARLDNFAVSLLQDQAVRGFIVVYAGKESLRGEARALIKLTEDYLFKTRGVDAGRAAMLNGGYREARTMALWLVPKGASPPSATPSVRPEDVRFKKGSARKFAARFCGV